MHINLTIEGRELCSETMSHRGCLSHMTEHYLIVGGSHGIGGALVDLLNDGSKQISVISRNEYDTPSGVNNYYIDVMADVLPDINVLHGLVYCPGSINLKPFSNLREKHFQQDFEINVLGLVKTLKKYAPALKAGSSEGKPSSVLAFSSVAVQTGMAYHASVAAAKGAVEGVVRSLAAEWVPHIRVNAIAPSLVDTPLASRLLRNDAQRESSAERHPLKRIGNASDIASAAVYLLHPDSGWITGQVLAIDGGMSSVRSI